MMNERPLAGALILVVVGAGLGLGYNLLHPNPIPWTPVEKKVVSLPDGQEFDYGEPEETPAADPASGTGSEAKPATSPPVDPRPAVREEPTARPTDPSIPRDAYADITPSEFPIEITLAQGKKFFDRGGLLVLDARESEEFTDGHIKGAVLAPADQMVGDLEWMAKTAEDPRPILIYCDGGECELSLNLGFELCQTGHRRILILKEGYPAWRDAGFPVATGETP